MTGWVPALKQERAKITKQESQNFTTSQITSRQPCMMYLHGSHFKKPVAISVLQHVSRPVDLPEWNRST